MRYFKIEKDTFCQNLGGWDADDEWSRDSYYESHTVRGIKEVKEKDYFDLPLEDGEGPIYLLYAIYDTGDSFGRDEGRFEAVMLHHDRSIAEENRRRILEQNRQYEQSRGHNMEDYSVTLLTDSGKEFQISTPWNGYFEDLSTVEIEEVEIL